MAENKLYETAQHLNQSAYETNKAIAQSAVAAQERNVAFVQAVFDNSIEILKSHVAASQSLWQTVTAQPENPQAVTQAVIDSTIEAQKRNVALAQSILEDGTRVAKSHVAATQELTHTLVEKAQQQQEVLSALPYAKAYADLFYAPLTYYKRVVETGEQLTNQALELAHKSAVHGMEVGQKVTQQAMEAVLTATRREQ
jgi:hypothetical protein